MKPRKVKLARAPLGGQGGLIIDDRAIEQISAEELVRRNILVAIDVATDFLKADGVDPDDIALVREARDTLARLVPDLQRIPGFAANVAMALSAVALIYSRAVVTEAMKRGMEQEFFAAIQKRGTDGNTAKGRAAHAHLMEQIEEVRNKYGRDLTPAAIARRVIELRRAADPPEKRVHPSTVWRALRDATRESGA